MREHYCSEQKLLFVKNFVFDTVSDKVNRKKYVKDDHAIFIVDERTSGDEIKKLFMSSKRL